MKATLEPAARALCRLDGHPENVTMEGKPLWKDFLREAWVVLEAIREPSSITTVASAEIIWNVGPAEDAQAHQSDAANTWRFMIDAELSERP